MINASGFGFYMLCLKAKNNRAKTWSKKIKKATKPKFCFR